MIMNITFVVTYIFNDNIVSNFGADFIGVFRKLLQA